MRRQISCEIDNQPLRFVISALVLLLFIEVQPAWAQDEMGKFPILSDSDELIVQARLLMHILIMYCTELDH